MLALGKLKYNYPHENEPKLSFWLFAPERNTYPRSCDGMRYQQNDAFMKGIYKQPLYYNQRCPNAED